MTTFPPRQMAVIAIATAVTVGGGAIALAATSPSLPDQASQTAVQAVQAADPGDHAAQGTDDLDEPDTQRLAGDEPERENAGAFAAWVASLPEDLGCVRGHMISSAARNGPTGDIDPLDVETATQEAATRGRCVEAATGEGGDEESGPPEWVGPTDRGGPPAHARAPAGAGPDRDRG